MSGKTHIQSAEPATNCGQSNPQAIDASPISVENKIVVLRDTQVILDRDLAVLYNVETSQLNRQGGCTWY